MYWCVYHVTVVTSEPDSDQLSQLSLLSSDHSGNVSLIKALIRGASHRRIMGNEPGGYQESHLQHTGHIITEAVTSSALYYHYKYY